MATYRQVQTAFWQDEFVLQLTPEEKYFYLYLLTNSKTKQCGIYQLPMQVIIMESGYNQETSEKLLKRFLDYGKIIYNIKTKEIGIVNWPKYNPMESPKTRVCVEKELKDVKDKTMIATIYPGRYPMQGVSQEEKEEEKEKAEAEAEEKEEEPAPELSSAAPAANEFISSESPLIKGDIGDSEVPLNKGGQGGCFSDDHPDYHCEAIQSQSEMLLKRAWNRHHPNPEEIRITALYIEKYGLLEVETAFTEGVKYDKKRLAYVEAVCTKRKERADLAKKIELERQKRIEQERKLEEQKKSGIGLGLIKMVYEKDDN
jgi:hypothetical protein